MPFEPALPFFYFDSNPKDSESTPVVFLHNGGDCHRVWHHQIEHFKHHYRVLAPDLPGFGQSVNSCLPVHQESLTQALTDWLERLNLHSIHLVGVCVGAACAFQIAQRVPERVRSLSLINFCGGIEFLSPSTRLAFEVLSRLPLKTQAWLLQGLSRLSFINRLILSSTWQAPDPRNPVWTHLATNAADPSQWKARLKLIQMIPSFRWSEPTTILRKPDLCMVSTRNQVLKPEMLKQQSVECGCSKIQWMDRSNHLPMAEEPDRVNSALSELFLGTSS